MRDLSAQFRANILQNPYNAAILQRLASLAAPQAYLVAGCLFQSIWNLQSARPVTENILDYDVFYFDANDLSWQAEDEVIQRAAILFADLPVKVEVRNQARVHLWYEKKFGAPYSALASTEEGISRFLIAGACVGISDDERIFAPHGLQAIDDGVLAINPHYPKPEMFFKKAASYQTRWPHLRIVSPA